jgi:mannose-1-phosphate guanylyltransferase/mannose-6-phosphate isomerase
MSQDSDPLIRPVILCGGAGTRLWPLSRKSFPKQLLSLTGEQSLLQQTATRLSGDRFAPAIIVSAEEQGVLVDQQLRQVGAEIEAILLEPTARNTSAAATLAAAWLDASGGDEVMLLMPSDHVISDRDAFLRAIEIGLPHAEGGAIVTFGATPTEPNTQYGYIEARADQLANDGAYPIARFHEKPSAEKASQYVESGRFFWNSGIFMLKASTLLDQMRQFLPASADAVARSVGAADADERFVRPQAEAFSAAENISIDHGVMERTSCGVVVPVQMEWSDVGSWDAVWRLGEKDTAGNVIKGEVVALDTHGSLLRSESGVLIATLGLQGIAVVDVGDTVLVAPLQRMDELKRLVEAVKKTNADRVTGMPHCVKA